MTTSLQEAMSDIFLCDCTTRPCWQGNFPVRAGGIFTLTVAQRSNFCIAISLKDTSTCRHSNAVPVAWQLAIQIGQASAKLYLEHPEEGTTLLACSSNPAAGVEAGQMTSYWLSLDAAGTIKYGKGYHMEQTMLLQHCLKDAGPLQGCSSASRQMLTAQKLVALYGLDGGPPQLCSVFDTKPCAFTDGIVAFERCPLACNPPPVIVDASELTLLDLGWQQGLPSTCLPPACRQLPHLYEHAVQDLYEQLSAPHVGLEHPESPQGSLCEAIRHSLATPGALLHRTLKAKAGRCFAGGRNKQCYIRAAVSCARGSSPGEPFVLEIWPPGHYSPIHDHGLAYGVTRILHGSLTLRIYNKHLDTEQPKPLQELQLHAGQLTWFSPNWYQTHQLENCSSSDFCCSINGFQYGEEDDVHWPYMQYKGHSPGDVHDFEPVSDFDFADLRSLLLEEYRCSKAPSSVVVKVEPAGLLSRADSPSTPDSLEVHLLRAGGSRVVESLSPSARGFLVAR